MSTFKEEDEDELKGAQCADVSLIEQFNNEKPEINFSLYKALSVPHLNSKSSRSNLSNGVQSRKKTSDANALPDPLLFAQLRHENQLLKDRLMKEEEDKKQVVGVNHNWDAQYNKLHQKFQLLEQQHKQLKEELLTKEKELASKDKKIIHLTKKIENFINNSCDEKPPAARTKSEQEQATGNNLPIMDEDIFETLRKTEKLMSEERDGRKMAMQQLHEFKLKYDYMENLLTQQTQQRIFLQNELKRLSMAIEQKSISSKEAKNDDIDTNRHRNGSTVANDSHDISLLKQQLQVFAEDFNAEKKEKQKLHQENQELKTKVTMFMEEKETLLKQLQTYEEDFQREREKRIHLMRERTNNETSSNIRPSLNTSFSSSFNSPPDNEQQKWKEYCCLVVEREQLSDRINDLETQGVVRYSGRSSSSSSQLGLPRGRQSQPPVHHFDSQLRDGRHPWPDAVYMRDNRRYNGRHEFGSETSNFRRFPDEI